MGKASARQQSKADRRGATPSPEIYSPERVAELLLNNAVDAKDYDDAGAEVRAMGIDPATIPHVRPD